MAFNLNIGILGHIDSGKTTLAKALSDIASTAAFDKNPQSQSRGITLDLGFSSYTIQIPENLKDKCPYEKLQYTLVDCPGHASLLKTIIGGAQIIDMMLLVIDATKGIQTQTAECLVICEITCRQLMIIMNKIDLFEEDKRTSLLEKATKKIRATLSKTAFADAPISYVSANNMLGIKELTDEIAKHSFIPERHKDGQFLFSVDHCFQIKGQGTVMTGTVLKGTASISDMIEIPSLSIKKKIKSMQMFKKPVQEASQGERLGICVTQFDAKLVERSVICTPGYAFHVPCVIIHMKRIKYFKGDIKSKTKYHITIGHNTAMGNITLFRYKSEDDSLNFSLDEEYEYVECMDDADVKFTHFALIEFDRPVIIVDNSILIGSKLDMDLNTNSCRIAFCGQLVSYSKDKEYKSMYLPKLKIYKTKMKEGILERYVDERTVIVKNMFGKTNSLQDFIGLRVTLGTGVIGKIDSTFGKSGKMKVVLDDVDSGSKLEEEHEEKVKVMLCFKRYVFDKMKKMYQ